MAAVEITKEMENNEQPQIQNEVAEYYIPIGEIISSLDGNNGGGHRGGSTLVEPQHELGHPPPSGVSSSISQPASLDEPEKKMSVFIRRLVINKKIVKGFGQIVIAWATLFHLSGFISDFKPKDLWFVTTILAVIGARLFSPSRIFSQPKGIGLSADVLLPYSDGIFESKNINDLLYWLQILAAGAFGTISLMRLGQQDYGEEARDKEIFILNVFYSLTLTEALMFLLEKGYWIWIIEHGKLLEWVNEELELGSYGMVYLCCFFDNAYSKCFASSIFDGLKMDVIAYARELLDSESTEEQIIGTSILQHIIENQRFAKDALNKIKNSQLVIRRLIEMLEWKDLEQKDIRLSASKIILKLASQHQQWVAMIPEVMKSIASLLHTGEKTTEGRPHEASPRDNEFSFNLLGLSILKHLMRDHDNCLMIQNVQGILERIIDLTSVNEPRMIHNALMVVNNLVSATGGMGKALRNDISKSEDLMSNIQELLECRSHLNHQMLGLEILTHLGMEAMAKENIGKRRGMLSSILQVFFRPITMEEDEAVCNKAGEALATLILDSNTNCKMMLRKNDVVKELIIALDNPVLWEPAINILRGLLHYFASSWKMIQNEQGILEQIIDLISVNEQGLNVVQNALIMVMQLVCATGESGKELRNYFLMSEDLMRNIQELLKCGRSHLKHQILGLRILTCLARLGMNEKARENIGERRRMLWSILQVFLLPIRTEEDVAVCKVAGEALTTLVLDIKTNCKMMIRLLRENAEVRNRVAELDNLVLRENVVVRNRVAMLNNPVPRENDVVRNLVDALDNPVQWVHAANILRGLLYCAEGFDELHIVAEKMPLVLKTIMTEKNEKLLEASVGLALQILKFRKFIRNEIERAGFNNEDFARKLVDILKGYNNPESKFPKMEILVIGLTIALMKYDHHYIQLFRDLEIDEVLIQFAKTTKRDGFNVVITYRYFDETLLSTLVEESSWWLWIETVDLIMEADGARWINLGP